MPLFRHRPVRFIAAALALSVAAWPALADRALLIGVPEGAGISADLREAGFEVTNAPAETVADMRAAISGLLSASEPGERKLIWLSGAFVHDDGAVWLLQTQRDRQPDRGNIGDVGFDVETALAVASRSPGAALVALGEVPERRWGRAVEPGTGLTAGLVPPDEVPQGVTVVHGPQRALADYVTGPALDPGTSIAAGVRQSDELSALGYVPRNLGFLPAVPASRERQDSDAIRPTRSPAISQAERSAWESARQADVIAAYREYRERFPNGAFAAEARAAIEAIQSDPERQARDAEEALGLSREERRQVQSQLTILGYEPQGVDGVLGPNSRAAISRFQAANSYPETGYLTRDQRETLAVAAAQRQAELEAEAERRRAQAEREDRAVWSTTGADGDEAGLRTYLRRYPDGLYADEARRALSRIEGEKRAAAEESDASAWERARATDTAEAYQAYLAERPQGAFASEAEARIQFIRERDAQSDERQAAQAAESQLGLNDVTRLLVEQRLAQLGLDPGASDGSFNDDTRRAIRAFQRDRGLTPTGYLTQQTVARMLADLGGIVMQGIQ